MRSPPRQPQLDVLYEDNHLLVVNKPAGLATMGLPAGQPTLLNVAKEYVARKYGKTGNVYLGITSRLDAPVTGVVVLARTSKAAARLTEQFRSQAVEKIYWAIVEGRPQPDQAVWSDYLADAPRYRSVVVVSADAPGAQLAVLEYRRLGRSGIDSLIEVRPQTGRKHQIRVQFAHRGHPLIGDIKYGSKRTFPHVALHARMLVVAHPTREETMTFVAPAPETWKALDLPAELRRTAFSHDAAEPLH